MLLRVSVDFQRTGRERKAIKGKKVKETMRNIPFLDMKVLILIPMPYNPPQKIQQVSTIPTIQPAQFPPSQPTKHQHERTYNDKAASNNSSPPAPSATPSDHASSELPAHFSLQVAGEPISLIGGRCIGLGCRGGRFECGRCGRALWVCLNWGKEGGGREARTLSKERMMVSFLNVEVRV